MHPVVLEVLPPPDPLRLLPRRYPTYPTIYCALPTGSRRTGDRFHFLPEEGTPYDSSAYIAATWAFDFLRQHPRDVIDLFANYMYSPSLELFGHLIKPTGELIRYVSGSHDLIYLSNYGN